MSFYKIVISKIPMPIRAIIRKTGAALLDNKIGNLFFPRFSLNGAHNYWKNINDEYNGPSAYLDPATIRRSELLFSIVKRYSDINDSILEIGCNVGRNLNYLYEKGYKKINGIEINKNAVDIMKKTFPDMASHCNIYNSPVEDIIGNLPENGFGVVFTLAVLEHVHYESNFVFKYMAKIVKNYLITIENEKSVDVRHFPRNYKEVFEPLGLKEVESFPLKNSKMELYCVVRVFKK